MPASMPTCYKGRESIMVESGAIREVNNTDTAPIFNGVVAAVRPIYVKALVPYRFISPIRDYLENGPGVCQILICSIPNF